MFDFALSVRPLPFGGDVRKRRLSFHLTPKAAATSNFSDPTDENTTKRRSGSECRRVVSTSIRATLNFATSALRVATNAASLVSMGKEESAMSRTLVLADFQKVDFQV